MLNIFGASDRSKAHSTNGNHNEFSSLETANLPLSINLESFN